MTRDVNSPSCAGGGPTVASEDVALSCDSPEGQTVCTGIFPQEVLYPASGMS